MGKYLPSDEEGIRGKYLKRDEKLKRKGGRRKRYFVSGEEKKGEGKGGQSFGDDVNFDLKNVHKGGGGDDEICNSLTI